MDDAFTKILKKSTNKSKKAVSKNDVHDILGEDKLVLVENVKTTIKKSPIIEWDDVKDKRFGFDEAVELWGKKKLFSYYRYRCKTKNTAYADAIDESIGIARRHSFMHEIFVIAESVLSRSVENQVIRSYIDYYVNNLLENTVVRKGKFDVYDISKRSNFKIFIKNTHIDEAHNHQEVSDETSDINEIYDMGGVNFVNRYGIVVSHAYLMNKKGLDDQQACRVCLKFMQDAIKEAPTAKKDIMQVTQKKSPYHESYKKEELIRLLDGLDLTEICFAVDGSKFF